jgi:hypothetical protein
MKAFLDLHTALDELTSMDERAARVIELPYFGGLTEKEAAEILGISVATLKRDWAAGRAWLVGLLGWELNRTSDKDGEDRWRPRRPVVNGGTRGGLA